MSRDYGVIPGRLEFSYSGFLSSCQHGGGLVISRVGSGKPMYLYTTHRSLFVQFVHAGSKVEVFCSALLTWRCYFKILEMAYLNPGDPFLLAPSGVCFLHVVSISSELEALNWLEESIVQIAS